MQQTTTTTTATSPTSSNTKSGPFVLVTVMGALLLGTTQSPSVDAFRPSYRLSTASSSLIHSSSRRSRRRSRTTLLFSSVGGGNNRPPSDGGGNGNGDLGDFLDPMRPPDSEQLQRAREYMSETSLPLSFETSDDDDEENQDTDDDSKEMDLPSSTSSAATPSVDTAFSALSPASTSKFNNSASSSALFGTDGTPSSDILAKNPYMQVVSKISPSEVISKFTATANPRVQEAVRTTILGLIGSLPKLAFETTSITTGQRLASLMFQLQMTGYMFKNAEYRMSMSQSLGVYTEMSSNLLLTGSKDETEEDLSLDREDPLLSGKIKGKLKIRYGKNQSRVWTPRKGKDFESKDNDEEAGSQEIEVDAAAYMSELRSEVAKLRDELAVTKEAKEEALRKDLLLYIRTLPAQELKSLTNTMSQDVLVCMKGLVQAVLAGIGEGQIGPDTVTEQSGEAMAQLCMWQLAVGYNLREMEVREEMKKNLNLIMGGDKNFTSGVDLSEPGALE